MKHGDAVPVELSSRPLSCLNPSITKLLEGLSAGRSEQTDQLALHALSELEPFGDRNLLHAICKAIQDLNEVFGFLAFEL